MAPEIAAASEATGTGGVLIAGVLRGGPADKAGFRPGDVLLAIDGKQVKDPNAMLNIVAALVPGRTAAVRLRRDEKNLDVHVEVGKRPAPPLRR